MKQRRPRPRKQSRQRSKKSPPTSTPPPPDGQMPFHTPLSEPTRIRATNPAPVGTSGIVLPPLPLRAEAALKGEGEFRADATLVRDSGIATKSEIERRLSEQPAVIRDTARALAREFKSQASELRRQGWNDRGRIAQRDNLVVLSENLANRLANLADNLDQAITKASEDKPEPVFLGKAAEVVQQLHFGFTEWLKENRTTLFEVPFRVGIFVTAVILLHSVGADSKVAITALGLLVAKGTGSKKKGRKK